MGLRWEGGRLKARVAAASARAIDATNARAAEDAASAWPRDTGLSAESFGIVDEARRAGDRVVGSWGAPLLSASGEYSESSRARVLFNEIGVRGRPGLGLMRRAFDRHNDELAGRIRREL
jgi:hypothetical protein